MKIIVINHYKGLTQKNTLCSTVNLQYDLKKQENNTYHMRRKPPINNLNEASLKNCFSSECVSGN